MIQPAVVRRQLLTRHTAERSLSLRPRGVSAWSWETGGRSLPIFDPERQAVRPRAQLVPDKEVAFGEWQPERDDSQPRGAGQTLDLDDMLAGCRIELGDDVVLAD